MPIRICEKCGKQFKQKCHYDQHMRRKYPCIAKGFEQKKMISFIEDLPEDVRDIISIKNYLNNLCLNQSVPLHKNLDRKSDRGHSQTV